MFLPAPINPSKLVFVVYGGARVCGAEQHKLLSTRTHVVGLIESEKYMEQKHTERQNRSLVYSIDNACT